MAELWQQVWQAGSKTSGGFGLWSHEIMFTNDAPTVARIWTETLTALGYNPIDIVLYGDWRDGRHMADEMLVMADCPEKSRVVNRTKAAAWADYIFNQAASPERVRKENLKSYLHPEAAENANIILGYFDEVTS